MEIWLTGLQNGPRVSMLLFISFLIIYLVILLGNTLIIFLVASTQHLHSPMYIFLCSLSLSEIVFTTNLIPMLLHSLLLNGSSVNITTCLVQFYVCASLGIAECLLFAVMSYDRYNAICNPLHYAKIMTLKSCKVLIITSWAGGFTSMFVTLIMICQLNFCGPNIIDHFFCDFEPLVRLSCSDTLTVKTETFIMCSSLIILPFGFVIGTYICIINTIFMIPSFSRRYKTFSTCSSHLISVCTYYGTLIFLYAFPIQGLSSFNKNVSLMYTVVSPMFNPIIYSLRNRDIKTGLQNVLLRLHHKM